jgi:hypothetical protein
MNGSIGRIILAGITEAKIVTKRTGKGGIPKVIRKRRFT